VARRPGRADAGTQLAIFDSPPTGPLPAEQPPRAARPPLALPSDLRPVDASLGSAIRLAGYTISTPEGQPLFFPFGLSVTLPAVLVPHVLLGIAEGLLTILVVSFLRRR
jgi:hypothetical protein